MTLRVNVFKPLFGLSRDELSSLWERRSGQAGPSAYLTIASGTDGLEVKAAKSGLDGAASEDAAGFIVDKRKRSGGAGDRGVLDMRCVLIPSSSGSFEFRYSGIGILGQICGSVNTSTGEVSTCYRALVTRGAKIELPDDEVSPFLAEIEDSMRLFNSHLSG